MRTHFKQFYRFLSPRPLLVPPFYPLISSYVSSLCFPAFTPVYPVTLIHYPRRLLVPPFVYTYKSQSTFIAFSCSSILRSILYSALPTPSLFRLHLCPIPYSPSSNASLTPPFSSITQNHLTHTIIHTMSPPPVVSILIPHFSLSNLPQPLFSPYASYFSLTIFFIQQPSFFLLIDSPFYPNLLFHQPLPSLTKPSSHLPVFY